MLCRVDRGHPAEAQQMRQCPFATEHGPHSSPSELVPIGNVLELGFRHRHRGPILNHDCT